MELSECWIYYNFVESALPHPSVMLELYPECDGVTRQGMSNVHTA